MSFHAGNFQLQRILRQINIRGSARYSNYEGSFFDENWALGKKMNTKEIMQSLQKNYVYYRIDTGVFASLKFVEKSPNI